MSRSATLFFTPMTNRTAGLLVDAEDVGSGSYDQYFRLPEVFSFLALHVFTSFSAIQLHSVRHSASFKRHSAPFSVNSQQFLSNYRQFSAITREFLSSMPDIA